MSIKIREARRFVRVLLCGLAATIVHGVFPGSGRAYSAGQEVAGAIIGYTVPTKDLTASEFDISATPAYFQVHNYGAVGGSNAIGGGGTEQMKGFAGALGGQYGVSPHLGLGITGVYFKSSNGTYAAGGEPPIGQKNGSSSMSGETICGNVIYDPFEGAGFRFPLSVGVGYQHWDNEAPTAWLTKEVSNSPIVAASLSPRFSVGPWFRVEPFAVVAAPLDKPTHTLQNCPNCSVIDRHITNVLFSGHETIWQPSAARRSPFARYQPA